MPPLPLCAAHCLPQQCCMAVPPCQYSRSLHLWLIVTFFLAATSTLCCPLPAAMTPHGSCPASPPLTLSHPVHCYLFSFFLPLPLCAATSTLCCPLPDDIAWQLRPLMLPPPHLQLIVISFFLPTMHQHVRTLPVVLISYYRKI